MEHSFEAFCIHGGIPKPQELLPIRSGRNSAVFKVSSEKDNWIIKNYFLHEADKRNRLGNEYKFLTFLKKTECSSVAKPIAYDEEKQLALYTFLNGVKPSVIKDWHIDQATEFIILLNRLRDHPNAKELDNAADACFDLDQHIQIVDARFAHFKNARSECNESIEILNWVRNVLYPTWLKIRSSICSIQTISNLQQITLSPSDFGFHNTLEYQGSLSFVDFEYSGWDSMAKLACDFICQPELPISEKQAKYFLEKLARETNDQGLIDQVHKLLPLHRVKWTCILLNVFREVDRQRRIHSGNGSIDILCQQLNKAKSYYENHLQDLYKRN